MELGLLTVNDETLFKSENCPFYVSKCVLCSHIQFRLHCDLTIIGLWLLMLFCVFTFCFVRVEKIISDNPTKIL